MKSQFNLPNKILEDYAIYKILSLFLSLTLLKHIGVLPLCGDTGVLCTVAVFHAWSVHRGMTEKVFTEFQDPLMSLNSPRSCTVQDLRWSGLLENEPKVCESAASWDMTCRQYFHNIPTVPSQREQQSAHLQMYKLWHFFPFICLSWVLSLSLFCLSPSIPAEGRCRGAGLVAELIRDVNSWLKPWHPAGGVRFCLLYWLLE